MSASQRVCDMDEKNAAQRPMVLFKELGVHETDDSFSVGVHEQNLMQGMTNFQHPC